MASNTSIKLLSSLNNSIQLKLSLFKRLSQTRSNDFEYLNLLGFVYLFFLGISYVFTKSTPKGQFPFKFQNIIYQKYDNQKASSPSKAGENISINHEKVSFCTLFSTKC